MFQEVFDLFRTREVIPYVILALVTVSWVIIFERFIRLHLIYSINFQKFNSSLRKMLAAGDMERARSFCLASAKVGVPAIVRKAIDTFETDSYRVRMVVSEEALEFFPRIRAHLSQLPNLAAAAVLLGALAAVHGIWISFHGSEFLEFGVKSYLFSRGMSNAIIPLAISLLASVLILLPYGILDALATRLENQCEHSLTVVLNILAPEMQTVFAQPGTTLASGTLNSLGLETAHTDLATSETHAAGQKGLIDEVAGERLDQVPDEEEII